ncbi:HIR complex subunit [Coemansia sp. RSA 552]|nr:HIR complex subunit [Coemansia sp. RSA 552]
MRITKPEWLRHDADKKSLTAIFSLDFDASGERLVTSGMDTKIRVWSPQAILQGTTGQQRLLATLTGHSGAVMCTRFSPCGRLLASGADDMVVVIWERDEAEGDLGAGSLAQLTSLDGSAPTETWRSLRRLTGHESDVCDLAWSADGRYLATCGLDNLVLVWDARTFERVARLTAHQQFVKGVTWDPAGRFLASQADDKTLRIWRTSDWTLQETVTQPFEDNIFSTYFRRPSWSPDGDCIAAANAANGKVPVAALVARSSWRADMSLVGHRAAIEVARFNPRVFTIEGRAASLCAAAGQDRGVSIWLTSQSMPLAAATNLFGGSVFDLAWHNTSDCAWLAACSFDGTVAFLELPFTELGTPISPAEQDAMLAAHGWVRRADDVPEGDQYLPASMHPRPIAATPAQVQLEDQLAKIQTSDGPTAESRQSQTAESRQSQIADIVSAIPRSGADQQEPQDTPPAAGTPSTADTPVVPEAIPPPTPVRTKDGKKRVAPTFVRPLGRSSSALKTSTTARPASPAMRQSTAVVPREAIGRMHVEAQVLGTRPTAEEEGAITTVTRLGTQSLVHAQNISAARVHLSVPKLAAQISIGGQVTVTAANGSDGRAQVTSAYWTKHFTQAVAALSASTKVTAVCLTDASLHWFDSRSGARLMPALANEALPAHLACADRFCLLLDCVGQLSVWDTESLTSVIDRVSIAPLLYASQLPSTSDEDRQKAPAALTSVSLCPDSGLPVLGFSDSRAFVYETRLRTWLRIADAHAFRDSDFSGDSAGGSRLEEIQRSCAGEGLGHTAVPRDVRYSVTLDHLEHQLMAASAIGDREGALRFVDILARRLAAAGDVARIRHWLRDLLGPPLTRGLQPAGCDWVPDLAPGLPKRQVLQRILPLLAANRHLQALISEYADALKAACE